MPPAAELDTVADQHKSKKMFRIDDKIHQAFKELAARNDRPMSREIRAALIRYLVAHDAWPPKTDANEAD